MEQKVYLLGFMHYLDDIIEYKELVRINDIEKEMNKHLDDLNLNELQRKVYCFSCINPYNGEVIMTHENGRWHTGGRNIASEQVVKICRKVLSRFE